MNSDPLRNAPYKTDTDSTDVAVKFMNRQVETLRIQYYKISPYFSKNESLFLEVNCVLNRLLKKSIMCVFRYQRKFFFIIFFSCGTY